MAKRQNPLSADARKALDLLRRNGAGDWFIFDAMEIVADGGVELAYGALAELSQAGFGRIYDGKRRFALDEAACEAIATASGLPAVEGADVEEDPDADEGVPGRIPVAQLADEAAVAGEAADSESDDLGPMEGDEAEPADNLTDDEITALAEWKGGDGLGGNDDARRHSSDRSADQDLLNRVLVELLALQLLRMEGIPGDPSEAVRSRIAGEAGGRRDVTRTAVQNAIAYCRRRGWLRTHRDYLMLLTSRGLLIAYRLAPRRFKELRDEIAYRYNPAVGTFSLSEP